MNLVSSDESCDNDQITLIRRVIVFGLVATNDELAAFIPKSRSARAQKEEKNVKKQKKEHVGPKICIDAIVLILNFFF